MLISCSTRSLKRCRSRIVAPNARTSGMLLITSTSSPSTAAASAAYWWCSGRPLLASRLSIIGQQRRDGDQRQRHQRADRQHHRDRPGDRQQRRQHVPGEGVLHRVDRVAGSGDAPGQRAGGTVGEIRRRMACEMMEQVPPQVAGDVDEGMRCDPAADPPQHVVRRDQPGQHGERRPDRPVLARRQRVDEVLDRILRRDRAAHGQDDRCQHHGMAERYGGERSASRTPPGVGKRRLAVDRSGPCVVTPVRNIDA